MRWSITHLTEAHRTRAEIAATNPQVFLASDHNDNTNDASTGGSAHFVTYQMRSLRCDAPDPSFTATVHGGLNGGIRRGIR